MKFSIIIPVYNVYDYLGKCLESVLNQTYDNYEVIIVNDGTKDNSQEIIKYYCKLDNRFKGYIKENGGLSDARNFGVKKATGDYIVFLDGDDYISKKLLESINEELKINEVDLVRYQVRRIVDGEQIECPATTFSNMPSINAFRELMKNELFVTAWSTAYNRKFFMKYKFQYAVGKLHEDFGLTPLIYLCAKRISCIPYVGYNYVIRENSIMTATNKRNVLKRNADMLYHFEFLINTAARLDVDYNTLQLFKSFVANAMIFRCRDLDGEILDDYLKELKRLKVGDYLLDDTFARGLKKNLFKMAPKFYIKHFLH